ncbi:MAG TPA: thioesterase domain-containing protein, partial [Mycobacterium sp.]
GVVVLRLLDEALATGDHIYAVIRGTAINNDGSDKVGFTAPSPVGQEEVIREALQIAEVPASEIGYVEAHGTGTAMGDPIELRALVAAHRGDGGPPERCVIGSIKANLGHLDAAAGVVGLIKTALVLKDQVIPGQPTLRTVNPRLGLTGSPYVVATATEKPRTPLRAATVSSFGLGGTNAHAVLVPAATDSRSAPPSGSYRIPVSASDAATLRESVGRLRDWLVGRPEVRVDDVALTLAHGRKALPARVTFEASDVAGLQRSLEEYLAQPGAFPGEGREGTADDVAEEVGDLSHARRLPLPGTPLRRTRHWAVARVSPAKVADGVPVTAPPETAAMLGARPGETLAGTALSGTALSGTALSGTALSGPAVSGTALSGPALSGTAVSGAGLSSDAVASRICEIVGAHLHVEVAPDDDIFDLGVESMTLVEIVTQLRDDLAVPISFEEAETTRTARLLADVLAPRTRGAAHTPADQPQQAPAVPVAGKLADGSTMRHALAPLRIGQGGRNVFLVHPAGGTTICYTDMGRQLSTRDSLYGIGFPMELAGRQQSIRDLARLYLGLIREVQPSGPYTVGGYSFGGNVAFEMALLLEAAGEDVERVIMFDSHPPEAYVGGHIGEADYLEAFPVLMRSLFADVQIPQGQHIGSLAEALELVRQPSWSPSVMRELESFFDVWCNNHQALRRYYPDTRLRADVLMLEAGEPENSQDLERLGMTCVPKDVWRTHLDGDFRVVSVTGNHFSMFRDPQHLKVLATLFEDSFAAAA